MSAFRVKVTQAPGHRGQAGVNIARPAWGVDRRPRGLDANHNHQLKRFSIAQAPKVVNPHPEKIRASKLPRSSITN